MSHENPNTIGMIPARLESSRLPDKALKDICGLTMIMHVYFRCLLAKKLDDVFVVTDSDQIAAEVKSYGGKVIMTGSHHQTGTDRLAEAASKIECDIIVNIQGDEALVDPNHIDIVVDALWKDTSVNVGILINPFQKYNSPSDIKVVINENKDVMYLSREDIPSKSRTENPIMYKAYHIIPFRKAFLLKYASWPKGKLEQIEFNEYLRILEKGYTIRTAEVESSAVSVDTIDDLEYVRERMPTDLFLPLYKDKFQ